MDWFSPEYLTHLIAAYPIRGTDVIRCAPDLVFPTGGTYAIPSGVLQARIIGFGVQVRW